MNSEKPTLYHVMIEPRVGTPWSDCIFSAEVSTISLTDAADWFVTWLGCHDVFINDGEYIINGDHIGQGGDIGVISDVSVTTPDGRGMKWEDFLHSPTAKHGMVEQDGHG